MRLFGGSSLFPHIRAGTPGDGSAPRASWPSGTMNVLPERTKRTALVDVAKAHGAVVGEEAV